MPVQRLREGRLHEFVAATRHMGVGADGEDRPGAGVGEQRPADRRKVVGECARHGDAVARQGGGRAGQLVEAHLAVPVPAAGTGRAPASARLQPVGVATGPEAPPPATDVNRIASWSPCAAS